MKKMTEKKLLELERWFGEQRGSIVAFSGGIDSSLLLFLARRWQGREAAIGVIANSESLKRKDLELAQAFCSQFDIILEVVETRELEDERYNGNPADRCFFCKEHLYTKLRAISEKYSGFPVLNGTNVDDHGDYRPGLKAAALHQVLSPLADCGITKEDIREIALHFELPNWDKPASPCLSSRIPYSHSITGKKLLEVEQAEDLLNALGFEDVRVRHYGDHGRIEVRKADLPRLNELRAAVVEQVRAIGFPAVMIDEEGLVSGKMNRVLKVAK